MAGYEKEAFTTPKGNLKWAFVEGKGKESDGKYKYQVVVKAHQDEQEVKDAIKRIDDFWSDNRPKNAKANPKSRAYKYEEDDATGELTGYVYFGMSTVTKFPSGDSKKVKIFTAKPPVREVSLGGKSIGDSSIGRGMGTLAIYEFNGSFGTTLYLDAISLSKFVEYVGGVDASNVVADEDADDINLGETIVGTESVEDEEDRPRV